MLPKFELLTPTTLNEASELAKKYGKQACFFAGGTDLLVMLHEGKLEIDYLISLKGIDGLRGIEYMQDGSIKIGALTTFNEIIKHPYILEYYEFFLDGMSKIGSTQVRNRATIGGNICNAIPSADSVPVLLVADAKLCLDDGVKNRELALNEFFLSTRKTALRDGEILTHIVIPPMKTNSAAAYYKFTRRKAMDIALFGVATYLEVAENNICECARIAFATSAPIPLRIKEAEEFLRGKELTEENINQAGSIAADSAAPRTSFRATAQYRKQLMRALMPRTIKLTLERLRVKGR